MRLLFFFLLFIPCVSFASNDDTLVAKLLLDSTASDVYCITDSTGDIARDTIRFSETTEYRIFDMYGNMVLRGNGTEVVVTTLPKGAYYLVTKRYTSDFRKM